MSKIVAGYVAASDPGVYSSKVTHWMMAVANLTSDAGAITVDDWSTVISNIQSANPTAKVILSIGGTDAHWTAMVANSGYRSTFITNVNSAISTYGFDGVSFDWEYPSNTTDGTNLVTLLSETKTAIGSLSLSYAAGNFDTFVDYVDVVASEAYCEFIMLMGYDYNWSTEGHHSQLYESEIFSTENNITYKMTGDNMVNLWIAEGVTESKIVLGCPFYGYYYESSHLLISYADLVASYIGIDDWYRTYDDVAKVPWLEKYISAGPPEVYYHIFYEDDVSIAEKASYIVGKDIGGMGIWLIEYDYNSTLLDTASAILNPTGGGEGGGGVNSIMAFGDYESVRPEWSDGEAPAINASNLNAISNTLSDLDEEARRSQTANFKTYLDYFLRRNVRTLELCQDYTEWTLGTSTLSNDYTNVRIGKCSLRITEPDSSAGWVSAYKNIDSIDLTKFDNGESVGEDDLIIAIFYCSDNTKFDSFTLKFGTNNSNCYYVSSVVSRSGWNCVAPRRSDFSLAGSGDWTDVTWVKLEAYNFASSIGEYISVNYVGIVKEDATIDNMAQPFYLDDGAGNWDVEKYVTYSTMALYFDPVIGKVGVTKGAGAWNYVLQIASSIKSFICSLEFYVQIEDEVPMSIWYADSSNYIMTYITSGTAYLYLYEAGSGTSTSIALTNTLYRHTKVKVIFEKDNTQIRVQYIFDSNENIVVLEDETIITDDGLVSVNGAYNNNNYGFLTDFTITNRESDTNFIIGSSKLIIKSLDQSISNTTITDDTYLKVYLPPNGIYEIQTNLMVTGDSATPDIKVAYSITGDIENMMRILLGGATDLTTTSTSYMRSGFTTDLTTQVPYGTYTSGSWVQEKLLLRTYKTGGVLTLRWAANASGTTTVLENSYMKVTKISR